jgi:hypothetical protein
MRTIGIYRNSILFFEKTMEKGDAGFIGENEQ